MIVITGAAGFIGSCLAKDWKAKGEAVVIVDDFAILAKQRNLDALDGVLKVERSALFSWLQGREDVSAILHIGARTDTAEFDYAILEALNLNYTKELWKYCTERQIPLLYASSAATYGGGEFGYKDDNALSEQLVPLNPYGVSKNEFDKWALQQSETPPNWYGLKFFNVYGPNEYHKGRMASVIFHAFNQIQEKGSMKLFRSHNPAYKDGEQLRDFVYVKDVLSVIEFLMGKRPESGLYNLGTGTARTFLDLVKGVFESLDMDAQITFMDTPADIRDKYQYFTEADMSKLREAGYERPFTALEAGVRNYVQDYLLQGKSY
ncbi:MAG: ADP-glyceromanno-heptose 6-epimerase [Flavobacteriales bacterium]|nr:ADP-glyceromanno-heptose 6-epimerase [Flavobacteriales bacterium]